MTGEDFWLCLRPRRLELINSTPAKKKKNLLFEGRNMNDDIDSAVIR